MDSLIQSHQIAITHLYQPPTSSRLGVTSLYLGVITCRILPINYTILFIHRAATDIFQLAFLILQCGFIKSWTSLPGLYHCKRTAAIIPISYPLLKRSNSTFKNLKRCELIRCIPSLFWLTSLCMLDIKASREPYLHP